MCDFIRSGERYALAILILCLSMTVCLGQEPPPAGQAGAQAVDKGTQEKAPPPTEAPAPADTVKVPEPVAVQAPAPAPAPADNTSKGRKKAAPKKGKGPADTSGGNVAFTSVSDKPYEIGPEDVLYVNVLHVPEVSGNVEVKPDGFVSIRFADEIKANGLTTKQLADIVTERLKKYYNNPEVNIQVVRILSKKYYISGEVRKAGAYSLSTPKTVFEALIEAGGPADFAKKKAIYILRGKQKISFNFVDVSRGKNLDQNILLQNGDVIVVP